MMTNAETARLAIDRINAYDYDALVPLLAPDIVVEYPFPVAGGSSRINGVEAVLAAFHASSRMFRYFQFYINEVHEAPQADTVIVFAVNAAQTHDGRPYQNRYGIVFTFRGGKITLWQEYFNPDLANDLLAGGGNTK